MEVSYQDQTLQNETPEEGLPSQAGKGDREAGIRKCGLVLPGCVSYEQGLTLQAASRDLVIAGEWDGRIILLEHPPVITIGRSGSEAHVCRTKSSKFAQNVAVIPADRGGDVTCHNPGQLVGYPILNLQRWQQDVHWYVHALEEVLIRTLARYGLQAGRKARYTGVWVNDEKIAAIGVSVKKWVTGHGFALNINNNLDLFEAIVPCGIRDFGVTSLAQAGIAVSVAEISSVVAEEFAAYFCCVVTKNK